MEEKKIFDLTSDNVKDDSNVMDSKDSLSNRTLTVEEQMDANKIVVEITDDAPIVVLFGAKTSGKTMTLVRLTRYLKKNNYIVEPIRTFRPGNSKRYEAVCDSFDNNMYNNTITSKGTGTIDFMLIKVSNKNADIICQILEAPGEHYFKKDEKEDTNFPTYIEQILSNDNHKTWLFIVELDWEDNATRQQYAKKISKMRNKLEDRRGDKVILMCHKADKKSNYHKTELFLRDVKSQYKEVFDGHENTNPILKYIDPYNLKFVVFSAGKFNKALDSTEEIYIPSPDKYPAELWETIQKCVKGGWF
jgi:hypothetical protein